MAGFSTEVGPKAMFPLIDEANHTEMMQTPKDSPHNHLRVFSPRPLLRLCAYRTGEWRCCKANRLLLTAVGAWRSLLVAMCRYDGSIGEYFNFSSRRKARRRAQQTAADAREFGPVDCPRQAREPVPRTKQKTGAGTCLFEQDSGQKFALRLTLGARGT